MSKITNLRFFSSGIALLILLFIIQPVQAIVVFSNLPVQNGYIIGYCLDTSQEVAMGFSVPPGTAYRLDSISFGLQHAFDANLTVSINADNGGVPGTVIGNLIPQSVTAEGVVTLSSGAIILNPGQTYYAVLSSTGSACNLAWEHGDELTPTGIFTYAGYLYRQGGAWAVPRDPNARGVISIDATPGVTNIAEVNHCPVFYDGRINDCDTFNPVVLYGKSDASDNWRLEVYDSDGGGLLFVVSPQMIAAVPECPQTNTLIYTDAATNISLYRLAEHGDGSCPFQMNAPQDEPGKWYIIIFDELYPHSHYRSFDDDFSS